MMKGSKICGVSDLETLDFIVNHPYPPSLVGFICNFKESPRYVKITKLKELLKIKKKQCKYVAVIVKNDEATLERIKIYHLIIIKYMTVHLTMQKKLKKNIIKK